MSNSVPPAADSPSEARREDFDELTLGPQDVLILRPRTPLQLSANYVERLNAQIPPLLHGRVLVVSDDLELTVVRNAAASPDEKGN